MSSERDDPANLYDHSHSYQSDRNFHWHRRRVWHACRRAAKRLDEMVSDNGCRNNRHWILFSVSRVHAGHRSRNISLPFLALTIYARCSKRLGGAWRWIYAIGAVICLYFNLFVLVVQ